MANDPRRPVGVGGIALAVVTGILVTIGTAVAVSVLLEVQFGTTSEDLEGSGASSYIGLAYLALLVGTSLITYRLISRR